MLLRILGNIEIPIISVLRDSQNYLHAADLGLGIYDMPHHKVKKDLEQMEQVINWLDRRLTSTPARNIGMPQQMLS